MHMEIERAFIDRADVSIDTRDRAEENSTEGIMYIVPSNRHIDRSVHTAPLYAAPRRRKINYSFATDKRQWGRPMPICGMSMTDCSPVGIASRARARALSETCGGTKLEEWTASRKLSSKFMVSYRNVDRNTPCKEP